MGENNLESRVKRLEEAVFGSKGQIPKAIPEQNKDYKGATGGLRFLLDDGFFDQPRSMAEARDKLRAEGYHYGNSTIAMGLVALVKQHLLTRLQNNGKWTYVVRK